MHNPSYLSSVPEIQKAKFHENSSEWDTWIDLLFHVFGKLKVKDLVVLSPQQKYWLQIRRKRERRKTLLSSSVNDDKDQNNQSINYHLSYMENAEINNTCGKWGMARSLLLMTSPSRSSSLSFLCVNITCKPTNWVELQLIQNYSHQKLICCTSIHGLYMGTLLFKL